MEGVNHRSVGGAEFTALGELGEWGEREAWGLGDNLATDSDADDAAASWAAAVVAVESVGVGARQRARTVSSNPLRSSPSNALQLARL